MVKAEESIDALLTCNPESGFFLSRMTFYLAWSTSLQWGKENKPHVTFSLSERKLATGQGWNQKTHSQECECSQAQFFFCNAYAWGTVKPEGAISWLSFSFNDHTFFWFFSFLRSCCSSVSFAGTSSSGWSLNTRVSLGSVLLSPLMTCRPNQCHPGPWY